MNEWVEQKDLKYHVPYNMYWETVLNRCNRKSNFFIYNLFWIKFFYS